jgi:acetate kinase
MRLGGRVQGPHGKEHEKIPIETHLHGLEHAFGLLQRTFAQGIADEVVAVGHRIVHGGHLSASCLLDTDARAEVKRAAMFAPLHNPAHLIGVAACEAFFPNRPQVRLLLSNHSPEFSEHPRANAIRAAFVP